MIQRLQATTLTGALIEAFAGAYLSPMYDNPAPTPSFHRTCWAAYCQTDELVAAAAPREHAKSTALTHDYGLAMLLFRIQDYVVLVSATEELAIGHLSDIAKELRENDDLIRDFKIKRLVTDAKTDVIVEFEDGHQARVIAKGSGQKMRGLKWNGKRPGLIVCDDLEEDEQVENRDRRRKFQRWFFRALLPCRRRGGLVRLHGTILHEDSLLARVMKSKVWKTLHFRAHAGFDDFSEILWPEQFPESRLRTIRQTFMDDGDAAGYSQEYLNDPFDNSEAYLRKDDFLPMGDGDHRAEKLYYVGCDFAISKNDRANRTSLTVGGTSVQNILSVVDQRVSRWDALEIIEEMFAVQNRWNPVVFFVEDGQIWKALAPVLAKEMLRRDVWLNLHPMTPVRDKATRGRPLQARMRAGGVKFDKDASWYEGYEAELLRFTGWSDAVLDDQFDSTATLVKGLALLTDLEDDDFISDDEIEHDRQDPRKFTGRSLIAGY